MALIYSHRADCWEQPRLMHTTTGSKRSLRQRHRVTHANLQSTSWKEVFSGLSIWFPLLVWMVFRFAVALYVVVDFETSHAENFTDAKDTTKCSENDPKRMGLAATRLQDQSGQLSGFEEHMDGHSNEDTSGCEESTQVDGHPGLESLEFTQLDLLRWMVVKKFVAWTSDRFSLVLQTWRSAVVSLVAECLTCIAWLSAGCLASGMVGYFHHRRQMDDKGYEDERTSGEVLLKPIASEGGNVDVVPSDSELQQILQQRFQSSLNASHHASWQ